MAHLLDRMKEHKEEFLLFANRFEVPFTNNQADRDLRAAKAHTKISGSFRSLDAAREYLTIMACISTAKKHQYSAYEALRMALDGTPEKILEKKASSIGEVCPSLVMASQAPRSQTRGGGACFVCAKMIPL